MKVLIAEDSRTMRNVQKKVLEGLPGTEVAEAADCTEALAAIGAATAPFDIILVDWNMPNMEGRTLVKTIRETDKATPVVAVTTEAQKTHVIEAINAGVNNYILMPFTPEVFLEKIKQTLAKRKDAA